MRTSAEKRQHTCCICRLDFTVRENANTFYTRQMCLECRKVMREIDKRRSNVDKL